MSNILGVSINKIALRKSVHAVDWTEETTIASNPINYVKFAGCMPIFIR